MKIISRLLAVIMIAVIVLTVASVTALADNPEKTAIELTSGATYTTTYFAKYNDCEWYRATVSEKGTLIIDIITYSSPISVYVLDSNGNYIDAYDYTETAGDVSGIGSQVCATLYSSAINKTDVELYYKVNQGTYYIKIAAGWNYDYENSDNNVNITVTFPQDLAITTSPAATDGSILSSLKSMLIYFTVDIPKGSTLQLGAITPGSLSKIEWKSHNTNVATVDDNGKVTSKDKGSAYIAIKFGKNVRIVQVNII